MTTETTIYHNPNCGTSRKVLGALREAGVDLRVVEYPKTPPNRAELIDLLGKLGLSPRQILRRKGTPYDALGLDDVAKTDDQLIDAILSHPILIERPIVVSTKGAAICRPPERVQSLMS